MECDAITSSTSGSEMSWASSIYWQCLKVRTLVPDSTVLQTLWKCLISKAPNHNNDEKFRIHGISIDSSIDKYQSQKGCIFEINPKKLLLFLKPFIHLKINAWFLGLPPSAYLAGLGGWDQVIYLVLISAGAQTEGCWWHSFRNLNERCIIKEQSIIMFLFYRGAVTLLATL